jgi:hypothetical protein
MKAKEIYNRLPSSWDEVTLQKFRQLIAADKAQVEVEDDFELGTERTVTLIAAFADTTANVIEKQPFTEVVKMMEKLAFLDTEIEVLKETRIKWKKIDQITYDDYVTFQKYGHDLYGNMPIIIKAFASPNMRLTEEEINQLNMPEVMTGFFTLRKSLIRLSTCMLLSLSLKWIKQKTKETVLRLTGKNNRVKQ